MYVDVRTPGQCEHKRAATWRDTLKFLLLGKLLHLDPKYELRCRMYAGHQKHGYPLHEDMTGSQWK